MKVFIEKDNLTMFIHKKCVNLRVADPFRQTSVIETKKTSKVETKKAPTDEVKKIPKAEVKQVVNNSINENTVIESVKTEEVVQTKKRIRRTNKEEVQNE